MEIPRRTLLRLAGAAVTAPTLSKLAIAQTYPARPITMIVPFPAGGPYDALGRLLADRMRGPLGQTIVIENVKDIVAKLNSATVEALADPGLQSRFFDLGLEIFPRERQTPEALSGLQKVGAEKWWPLIKEFEI